MISVRNRKTSIPLLVAFFFATVAKFDIYVHMVFIVNYGDSLQLTSALVFMVVGGIRTTTERGL